MTSTAARTVHHPAPLLRARAGLDDGLARSSAAELGLAREHRDALVAAASQLTAAAGHDPDVADCREAGCGLGELDGMGAALCAVAHRLSHLPDAPPPRPGGDLASSLTTFAAALLSSADAIRACRQTAHSGDQCWFSPAPGLDGCGEVLRLLHRWG